MLGPSIFSASKKHLIINIIEFIIMITMIQRPVCLRWPTILNYAETVPFVPKLPQQVSKITLKISPIETFTFETTEKNYSGRLRTNEFN